MEACDNSLSELLDISEEIHDVQDAYGWLLGGCRSFQDSFGLIMDLCQFTNQYEVFEKMYLIPCHSSIKSRDRLFDAYILSGFRNSSPATWTIVRFNSR